MKPSPDVSGVPFNFDTIPLWLYPDIWDETKQVRCRGLWFVVLYMLSVMVFFAIVGIAASLIFAVRTIPAMLMFAFFAGGLGGVLFGLSEWRDFVVRRRELLKEMGSDSI
jgi:hypothetical protein